MADKLPSDSQVPGQLLVAATPLGHLGDVTPRLRWSMAHSQLVCAEDTRRARVLYSALKIKAPPIWSLHAHNEVRKTPRVLAQLQQGRTVLLLSDAGTPVVSDPGAHLIGICHSAHIPIHIVPGPSAWACAVSGAGFLAHAEGILFVGFLGREPAAQRAGVRQVLAHGGVVVLFEAANRLAALLAQLAALAPEREACVCREMTKRHEQLVRGSLPELAATFAPAGLRGEVTLVLGPGTATMSQREEKAKLVHWHLVAPAIDRLLAKGMQTKEIASTISQVLNIPKSLIYQQVLQQQAMLASS